jgi:hypothetical protein
MKITKEELVTIIKEVINESYTSKVISKEFGGTDDSQFLKIAWKLSLDELQDLLATSISDLKWLKAHSKGILNSFNRKDALWVAGRIKFIQQIITSKKKNPNFIPDIYK